jgi:hypothetical protein
LELPDRITKWRIHQVYAAFGNLAMPD